jgi:glyoxylase-like metal-dependent hydrolase (beta-lactamase superfamily II)
MTATPDIQAFFDEPTNTISYLVSDPSTGQSAVIDPVLDYDPKSGEVDTRSVETILKTAADRKLTIVWALETHAHADHLSGAPYIKAKTGAKIGIGEHIKDATNLPPDIQRNRHEARWRDFDHLFKDGEVFKIGNLAVECIYTPGHTPADLSYKIGDAVFVGDTMFMPDYGTARADFPAAMRTSFTARSGSCCHCRRRRACSCVTTTRLPDATPMRGKPLCANSASGTSTSAEARLRTNL